jgi:hypothetical protein
MTDQSLSAAYGGPILPPISSANSASRVSIHSLVCIEPSVHSDYCPAIPSAVNISSPPYSYATAISSDLSPSAGKGSGCTGTGGCPDNPPVFGVLTQLSSPETPRLQSQEGAVYGTLPHVQYRNEEQESQRRNALGDTCHQLASYVTHPLHQESLQLQTKVVPRSQHPIQKLRTAAPWTRRRGKKHRCEFENCGREFTRLRYDATTADSRGLLIFTAKLSHRLIFSDGFCVLPYLVILFGHVAT